MPRTASQPSPEKILSILSILSILCIDVNQKFVYA